MATIYQLKPAFQALLRPLVNALARAGVTANEVTIAAVILAIAVGLALIMIPGHRVLLLLPLTLFVRMALNAIDGMLAREHGQASKLGAILNELCDVTADAAMVLPLALRPEFPPAPIVVWTMLAIVVEMTGVIGVQIGATRRYDGPFGKSDRAFAIGAIGLALGLGVASGAWVAWLFRAMIVLSVLTIANRAHRALVEVSSKGSTA